MAGYDFNTRKILCLNSKKPASSSNTVFKSFLLSHRLLACYVYEWYTLRISDGTPKFLHILQIHYPGVQPHKEGLNDRLVEMSHALSSTVFYTWPTLAFFRCVSIAGVSSSSSQLNSLTLFISSPPTLNTTLFRLGALNTTGIFLSSTYAC